MLASGECSVLSVRSSAGSRLRMCRGAPSAPGHPSGRGLVGTGLGVRGTLGAGGRFGGSVPIAPLPREVLIQPLLMQVQAVPDGRHRSHPCHLPPAERDASPVSGTKPQGSRIPQRLHSKPFSTFPPPFPNQKRMQTGAPAQMLPGDPHCSPAQPSTRPQRLPAPGATHLSGEPLSPCVSPPVTGSGDGTGGSSKLVWPHSQPAEATACRGTTGFLPTGLDLGVQLH